MSDPIVMSIPDPSDHAARAKVLLDNIHDRMRGGDGPELRTRSQQDLMANEAIAHALLALNETLLSIFSAPASTETAPESGTDADELPAIAVLDLDDTTEVPEGISERDWNSLVFTATRARSAGDTTTGFSVAHSDGTGIEYVITFRTARSDDYPHPVTVTKVADVTRRRHPWQATVEHGTSSTAPDRFADTTPIAPGPIPGVEHYVTPDADPATIIAGPVLDGADFATAKSPRRVLATFDLHDTDPRVAPGDLYPSAWPHVLSAAATAHATGSVGAFTTDPATGIEYAINFRKVVSGVYPAYRVESITSIVDVTRRIDNHLVSFDEYAAANEKPMFGLRASAWNEIRDDAQVTLAVGEDRNVSHDRMSGDSYEIVIRRETNEPTIVDVFRGAPS